MQYNENKLEIDRFVHLLIFSAEHVHFFKMLGFLLTALLAFNTASTSLAKKMSSNNLVTSDEFCEICSRQQMPEYAVLLT